MTFAQRTHQEHEAYKPTSSTENENDHAEQLMSVADNHWEDIEEFSYSDCSEELDNNSIDVPVMFSTGSSTTASETVDCGITINDLDVQAVPDGEKAIYPNARLTNAASLLLIMTFAVTHKLSGEALKDLLTLINMHCLIPNPLIQSLYKFKKYFNMLQHPIKKHYYCPNCCISIDSECTECPNFSCKETISPNTKSFFIEIPIIDQLKVLFSRKGFYNSLNHRFVRTKKNGDKIEDIYDGAIYQKQLKSEGFLSQRNNISFTWNTDGIPVFKSSKYGIWPLYFAINELSPQKRWRSDNILLAGLWFGPQKPNMLTFLNPFKDTLSTLHAGVELYSPDIASKFNCRGILLCGTCDLPAKAIVHNMVQFNGNYGCTHCSQSGKSLKVGLRGNVHVYPYIQSNPSGPERTDKQLSKHSRMATDTGKSVFGVKGPSWLSLIPGYSVIEGNVVDYMHCVLLGVSKMLIKLWFDSDYSKEMWYCGNKVTIADSKLLQIKPPLTISRTPRSIQEHRAYWKASEYRSWLLFYSVPVMFNILPKEYLAHHMLLVEAIYLLLQDSIAPADISKAEKLIQHYCFKASSYYSERFMTANVHHLLHLSKVVQRYGPLYNYSCFTYENLNGCLLDCIKGTQHVDQQIVEKICIKQSLPYIAHTQLAAESEERIFYNQMMHANYDSNKGTVIQENCYALGKIKETNALTNVAHHCALMNITKSTRLGTFTRAAFGVQVIHSLEHTQTKKRNNYTVSYHHSNLPHFGEVLYFVTDFISIYALIMPFTDMLSIFPQDDITNCNIPHMHAYASRNQSIVHIVEISTIKLCVSMSFEEQPSIIFVAQQPNNIEITL